MENRVEVVGDRKWRFFVVFVGIDGRRRIVRFEHV